MNIQDTNKKLMIYIYLLRGGDARLTLSIYLKDSQLRAHHSQVNLSTFHYTGYITHQAKHLLFTPWSSKINLKESFDRESISNPILMFPYLIIIDS